MTNEQEVDRAARDPGIGRSAHRCARRGRARGPTDDGGGSAGTGEALRRSRPRTSASSARWRTRRARCSAPKPSRRSTRRWPSSSRRRRSSAHALAGAEHYAEVAQHYRAMGGGPAYKWGRVAEAEADRQHADVDGASGQTRPGGSNRRSTPVTASDRRGRRPHRRHHPACETVSKPVVRTLSCAQKSRRARFEVSPPVAVDADRKLEPVFAHPAADRSGHRLVALVVIHADHDAAARVVA